MTTFTLTFAVQLAALVVKSMRDLVTYGPADGSVVQVHRTVSLGQFNRMLLQLLFSYYFQYFLIS